MILVPDDREPRPGSAPPRSRGLWLLAPLALTSCDAALQRFGEAMILVAIIGLCLAVAAGVLLFVALAKAARWTRAARAEGAPPTAARAAFRWTLLVTALHAGLILMTSEFRYGQGEVAQLLVFAGALTIGLLLATAVMAARRRVYAPLPIALALAGAWVHLAHETYLMRPLAELPGRVVELGGYFGLGCARLSTGQVACVGTGWNGERGDGSDHGDAAPTLVRGLDDAIALYVGEHVCCALRRDAPPVCWGGDDELPVPGSRLVPWILPGADDAETLATTRTQLLWRTRDGSVRGWPEAPPAELSPADSLISDAGTHATSLCVAQGEVVTCWRSGAYDERVRLELPTPVAWALDGERERLCAASSDAVRCFDLSDPSRVRTLALVDVVELLVVHRRGWVCARTAAGDVSCWKDDEPATAPLAAGRYDRIFGADGLVCGEAGATRRCVALSERPTSAPLIDLDRAP